MSPLIFTYLDYGLSFRWCMAIINACFSKNTFRLRLNLSFTYLINLGMHKAHSDGDARGTRERVCVMRGKQQLFTSLSVIFSRFEWKVKNLCLLQKSCTRQVKVSARTSSRPQLTWRQLLSLQHFQELKMKVRIATCCKWMNFGFCSIVAGMKISDLALLIALKSKFWENWT